jgi:biopolymer transport protein TolQ
MNISQDLSMLTLVLEASWVVQFIMLLLALASLASWWLIFYKYIELRREKRRMEAFESAFWKPDEDMRALFKYVSESKEKSGLEEVFRMGYSAHRTLIAQPGANPQAVLESARRAMRAAYQREVDLLDAYLPFLATVGSVSPYVGLLGTVWGIMNSFRALSNVAQASLAHVAPGIAEALIATAIGLFAAIPAVVAYNRFTHDVDRLANRLEVFMEEFSIILQRRTL